MTSILARLVTNVGIFVRSLTGLFVINAVSWGKLVIFLTLLSSLIWRFRQKRAHTLGERLVVFTLLFSVFGLSFYRETLFDHYLAFLYPVASIFIGMFLSWVWEKKQIKLLVIPPLAVMIIAAGVNFPGKQNLGYNIYMMKRTAAEIEKRLVPGEKYNIFLISPSNDVQGLNYRYFLTVDNKAPESETEFFNFSTLYVLQDIPEDKLTFSSHYMFAIWPNRNVMDSFSIPGGPRIYVLKR